MSPTRWLLVLLLSLPAASASAAPPSRSAPGSSPKAAANPAAEAAYADIRATLGFVPTFLKRYPAKAIAGAWSEMKALEFNPKTVLSHKDKELIGLGVAAQIPCTYCVYVHTKGAKAAGATDDEVAEAVATAASARHWSAVLHGYQFDMAAVQELGRAMEQAAKRAQESGGPAPAPTGLPADAATAKAEMQAAFGTVPAFVDKFPPQVLPGAWQTIKDLDMAPDGALSPRQKLLISVAVESQIPCDRCLAMDLPAARQMGASDAEISEAVAMSAITRLWSTMVNGMPQDLAAFRKEIDQAFGHAAKAAGK